MRTTFFDWNLISYPQALEKQTSLFNTIIRAKQNNESYQNYIIMCEHPHVYTLGRNGKEQNMLIGEEQLKRINATLYRTDRGGDITYHGPGQLVCYPILNLEEFGLGLKSYIYKLEEAVIRTCAFYNLTAGRLPKATGVWMEEGAFSYARKICAIGIRSSHYVTMHGLALNVNTDLRYFNYIHPCGFTNKGVTSIQKESGKKTDMQEVKEVLLKKIYEIMA
jgi:lipoyl(octanoyl) transferase